ncbi:hybrid sensor histidine kinase/response regulator [Novipirellula artificiosorum]|uniref:histidine kinase n=1 Tax=Novipirellula artificiosorum TaxID=2528016 RepID=A0A5C6D8L6_9BACT|nr:response regulator [Novipirellula artificiosorum]TWU32047.1 Sensor histidine kinase TmoS [Novipirellula artificiosorum]
MINLLINASKYTLPGGAIWFDLDRENDRVVITVRDSGEGVPKELQESIFEMFVQSETTLARSSGGMGVGLSLARIITEAHDGTISVQSDGVGHGSTFKIQLPLSERPLVQKLVAKPVAFDGRKLLLVEDNDDARMMLSETLRLEGFVVAEASDGPSALEQFQNFKPEIALIDIGLPEMDGYQIASKVRKMDGFDKTTLIALTGYARESDRQAAIEAGFDFHLAKPLNPIKFYERIAAKGPAARADNSTHA